MREARVIKGGTTVGRLTETDDKKYIFKYDDEFLSDSNAYAISVNLPKQGKEFRSDYLFPFFFSLLSEGANKKIQCTIHHIDEKDSFGLLLATAMYDTIGEITVEEV